MKINQTNKLITLFNQIEQNEGSLSKLKKETYYKYDNSFLRVINKIDIDTTPTYYGIYKFLGTTYSSTEPSPSEAYEENDNGTYTFIYPVWNFPALLGTDPEDYTYGATPWELQTYVAVVNTRIVFPFLKEKIIDGSRIISQLHKLDGTLVSDLSVVLREKGQNQDKISIDFTYFYRWLRLTTNVGAESGMALDYYAIYPISTNVEESDLVHNASIYFYNPAGNFYGQSREI